MNKSIRKQTDSLGDRMKRYEQVSKLFLTKKVPVIGRLDGNAFHTLTKHCKKPFDESLMNAMSDSCIAVMNKIQGCKVAYTQSDEVTFLITDYETIDTMAWFDYNVSKLVSISASTMSVAFNKSFESPYDAIFDARFFNVPKEDVINNFLWRAKDWNRNSLQMYCRSIFSHKQLHGANRETMHNMLHESGKKWTTDLNDRERNGRFFIKTSSGIIVNDTILPTYQSMESIIKEFL